MGLIGGCRRFGDSLRHNRDMSDLITKLVPILEVEARGVSAESLAGVFEVGPFAYGRTFHAAFAEQFGGAPPAILNESHRLVTMRIAPGMTRGSSVRLGRRRQPLEQALAASSAWCSCVRSPPP